MQKKKYNLTSDLINLDDDIINKENENHDKSKYILLTMSVDEQFRYEFKTWCARHRMKMNEAFVKSFTLLKEKYGP